MDVVQKLRRWEAAGGHVELQEDSAGLYTVTLTSCDGGEEMERFSVASEELRGYVNQ